MMSTQIEGLIIKGIGGFYYVEAADRVYDCKARGIFRLHDIVPTVGDRCTVELGSDSSAVIADIAPRRNILVRPPVANLDKLFVVVSSQSPAPNTLVIDRVIAAAEYADIEPLVIITKTDLSPCEDIQRIYSRAGFKVITVNYDSGDGIERIRAEMTGAVSAFAGNSGVGKSTLLNAIDPTLSRKTAQTSAKLGRGRHTTREVELFRLPFGGMIADTPGFSSFDGELGAPIDKDQLQFCFREFAPFLNTCQFTSCTHIREKGCRICQALSDGVIAPSRHESYVAMYQEAKNRKPWEQKK